MSLSNTLSQQIANYNNPNSIGFKLRAKRIELLVSMIQKTYEKYGAVNILDIGGRKNYWSILPQEILKTNKVHITVVNLPGEILPATEEH